MRLQYFISTILFLFHFGVLGDETWQFPEKVPGWNDLRECLRNCITLCNVFGCTCPVAEFIGCRIDSVICVCGVDARKDATDWIFDCVARTCNTSSEPPKAAKIFDNFCNEYYPSNISVGPSPSETGNTTSPLVMTTCAETAHSTAQQGVNLLWNTIITLMVSLVATIAGLMAL